MELWTLFEFLNPGLLGGRAKFQQDFILPISRFQDDEAISKLKQIISPFILRRVKTDKNIIIGSGWQPGCSSDKDAVLIAENFEANSLINVTNVDYVYDKDPKDNPDAKPLEKLSWEDMRKLVGDKWEAGANLPFDPIASQHAKKIGLTVIIVGSDLENFKNLLTGGTFKGTTITP